MTSGSTITVGRAVAILVSLKWNTLRGGLRRSNQARIQILSATLASLLVGLFAFAILAVMGRSVAIADDLLIVLLPTAVLGIGLLSAATGVEATIDPRHLASEPIGRWHLGLGLTVAGAVGPPAAMAVLSGAGVMVGWWPETPISAAVVAVAVIGWWWTLLLFSRTLANLLGAVATTRFRQLAHAGATLASLGALLVTQIVAANPSGWDSARWNSLAAIAAWTPPGQLGLAVTDASDPAGALVHLVVGLVWLPLLVGASVWSTERLALSSPHPGGGVARKPRSAGRSAPSTGSRLRQGPSGTVEALTRRTIVTKYRTPRQAVNTITALVVGAAVYLLAPFLGTDIDSRIVIVAGAVHFAVLFDGNNAFGMDGPAMWIEVASGADGRSLIRAKVLSSLTLMGLPAILMPLGLALITGGWRWLPAGWLVAAGSVFAAAGVAVVSATLAPFALPDSPNPLAGGDTGQGCVAGMMLAACVITLAIVSAPVALAIALATQHSATMAVLVALLAPAIGLLTLWGSVTLATARLDTYESELLQKVTPAR